VKAIARRLRRLEGQFGLRTGGRGRLSASSYAIWTAGQASRARHVPEDAEPDGALSENVVLSTSGDGREPTEEELDQ
jgi:hypothetical protein